MRNIDAYVFGLLAAIVFGSYLVFAAALIVNLQTVKPNVLAIVSNIR